MQLVIALLLAVTICSARADTIMVDGSGFIVSASQGRLEASTGCSILPTSTVSMFTSDDPIYDPMGRYRWRVFNGRIIKAPNPQFSSDAPTRRQQMAALITQIDTINARVITLERWQATPALVNALNRQAELDALNARLTALENILSGP